MIVASWRMLRWPVNWLTLALVLVLAVQATAYWLSNGICSGWGTGNAGNGSEIYGADLLPSSYHPRSYSVGPIGSDNYNFLLLIIILVMGFNKVRDRQLVPVFAVILFISVLERYTSCRLVDTHDAILRLYRDVRPPAKSLSSRETAARLKLVGSIGSTYLHRVTGEGETTCSAFVARSPSSIKFETGPRWITFDKLRGRVSGDVFSLLNENLKNRSAGDRWSVMADVSDNAANYSLLYCVPFPG